MRFIKRPKKKKKSTLERNLKMRPFVAFLPFLESILSTCSVSHQRVQMKKTVCFHLCVPSQVWVNVLIIANSCRPTFKKQSLRACTGELCLRESQGWQGTLTDHVRQQNCRLLRPPCHQAHLSGRWPYLRGTVLLLLLRDHTGTAARWSRPVLLTCSPRLCDFESL